MRAYARARAREVVRVRYVTCLGAGLNEEQRLRGVCDGHVEQEGRREGGQHVGDGDAERRRQPQQVHELLLCQHLHRFVC